MAKAASIYYIALDSFNHPDRNVVKFFNRLIRLNHRGKIKIRKIILIVEVARPSIINSLAGNVVEKDAMKIVRGDLINILTP